MKYTVNYVFTKVSDAVLAEYPDANCTSRFESSPSSFPCVFIHEINRFATQRGMTLQADDVQWQSSIEVQITSNKEAGSMEECRAIMNIVRDAFARLYYREYQEYPNDSGTKSYLVGRFRRVIGGGDVAPT